MGRGNVAEEERLLEAVMRDDEIPEVRRCSPQTTTKIVNRIRAMCMRLLEIEVDTDELRSPTSRCAQSLQYSSAAGPEASGAQSQRTPRADATHSVITHEVIDAFAKCGGDFADAVPYCLMEARRWFKRQSRIEPADFGEHLARSTACEVLARRIMTKTPVDRQYQVRSLLWPIVRTCSLGDLLRYLSHVHPLTLSGHVRPLHTYRIGRRRVAANVRARVGSRPARDLLPVEHRDAAMRGGAVERASRRTSVVGA